MSIVNLTESAKAQMSAMIEEHQKPAVRLSLQGGGCAGFKYNWTMAEMFGSFFDVSNPSSTSSCGCGESIGF